MSRVTGLCVALSCHWAHWSVPGHCLRKARRLEGSNTRESAEGPGSACGSLATPYVCVFTCHLSVCLMHECVPNVFLAAAGCPLLVSLHRSPQLESEPAPASFLCFSSRVPALSWLPSYRYLCAFLSVCPSVLWPHPFLSSLLSLLPPVSFLSSFTFPWTEPLGSFPGICFRPPVIGEYNLKTFFMKPGETLQPERSSMVCTFCGSLNT